MQGCKLWSHPEGLTEAPLPEVLRGLVGSGCAGPPVDVGGWELTEEQRARCGEGLDARQLAMLRAQVHSDLGARVAAGLSFWTIFRLVFASSVAEVDKVLTCNRLGSFPKLVIRCLSSQCRLSLPSVPTM